mmetsp:Transcript_18588/g.59448  ORF Transcript_18588/g.59448 Transcript_18588/m.59448 type:complete len:420 (-) Transcript_18588:62-1321(-)
MGLLIARAAKRLGDVQHPVRGHHPRRRPAAGLWSGSALLRPAPGLLRPPLHLPDRPQAARGGRGRHRRHPPEDGEAHRALVRTLLRAALVCVRGRHLHLPARQRGQHRDHVPDSGHPARAHHSQRPATAHRQSALLLRRRHRRPEDGGLLRASRAGDALRVLLRRGARARHAQVCSGAAAHPPSAADLRRARDGVHRRGGPPHRAREHLQRGRKLPPAQRPPACARRGPSRRLQPAGAHKDRHARPRDQWLLVADAASTHRGLLRILRVHQDPVLVVAARRRVPRLPAGRAQARLCVAVGSLPRKYAAVVPRCLYRPRPAPALAKHPPARPLRHPRAVGRRPYLRRAPLANPRHGRRRRRARRTCGGAPGGTLGAAPGALLCADHRPQPAQMQPKRGWSERQCAVLHIFTEGIGKERSG